MKHISYCCTCCVCLLLLFVLVYLGKTHMNELEPMVIGIGAPYDSADLLLDQPSAVIMKNRSYAQSHTFKKPSTMSSFEQTTNNQSYTHPDNGSMELPELSGFY